MLPQKKYTVEAIARIAWRRRHMILLPFAVGLAALPMLVGLVPEMYRSDTVIMVIPQRVPDRYVKATVTDMMEERLPTITAQILSRSRLERIVQEFNLYPDLRKTAAMEDVVARFRADITGPTIVGTSDESSNSFSMSYSNRDPVVAQKVATRLASLYFEQNTQDRTQQADSTSLFIEKDLEDAERLLVQHEKRLEAFRVRHSGQLPSQLPGNNQIIQNTETQLRNLAESMDRAKERRLLIDSQLAAERQPSTTTAVQPVVAEAPGVVATAKQELERKKAALEREKKRYTSEHPAIGELEHEVRQLEAAAAEEARAAEGRSPRERPVVVSPSEADRQRRIRSLETEIEVIDLQLASDRAEEARLTQRLAVYEANVAAVPTRESELAELTRGYESQKAIYEERYKNLQESKTAANLERDQSGEQFQVIDRATLPEVPFNRSRRLQAMAAGPIAGLLLGLLLAAALELRDSTFKGEEDVLRALTLPVLALIPAMPSESERRAQRWRRIALDATTVSALMASVVVVFWRLPL